MRDYQQSSSGLEGSLLIAHPNLLDPNFRRTVLFITAYDLEEGSLGLILNRQTDKTVGDVLSNPQALGPLGRMPVFFGGPVGLDRLSFAAFRWHAATQTVECQANIELELAKELALDDDFVVRGFIGYSGWSAGQLENELEQKTWVVQKPDREVLDPESCKAMWFSIMQNYGPWFRLLAAAPDDPSLN